MSVTAATSTPPPPPPRLAEARVSLGANAPFVAPNSVEKLFAQSLDNTNPVAAGEALRQLDAMTQSRTATNILVAEAGAVQAVAGTTPNGTLTSWPVPGHTTLNPRDQSRGQGGGEFGANRGTNRSHEGIDISAPVGSQVVAAGAGTVVDIRPNPSQTYGNQIVIDHGVNAAGERVYSQSAHLDSVTVRPGDTVISGQQIGTVGRTGNTPARADAHLHFEVRIGDPGPRAAVVDPLTRLPALAN